MRDYDLLVFDFDGTLADSREGIVATVNHALTTVGHAPAGADEIYRLVGLPLDEVFIRLFEGLGLRADHVPAVEAYRSAWVEVGHARIELFPGILDLLRELHGSGRTMAIATGKSLRGIERSMRHFGLEDYFSTVATTDSVPRGKPFPDMMEKILCELGIEPKRALMVGDTTFDLEMAHAAGADSVGVTYGGHSRAELEGASPKFLVETPEALADLLLER